MYHPIHSDCKSDPIVSYEFEVCAEDCFGFAAIRAGEFAIAMCQLDRVKPVLGLCIPAFDVNMARLLAILHVETDAVSPMRPA